MARYILLPNLSSRCPGNKPLELAASPDALKTLALLPVLPRPHAIASGYFPSNLPHAETSHVAMLIPVRFPATWEA